MAERPPMNIYAGADFLTPGAAETIDLISRSVPLDKHSRVIEVAYGTGEGACRLAERHGCRVLGIDMHALAKYTARRAASRGVSDRVAFATGDGGRLPVRDGAFDAAICIGAPSIVGTERCLAAMRRALRTGGMLAVSDWVWRAAGVPAQAVVQGIDPRLLTLDGYADLIREAGFEIASAEPLPQSAWTATTHQSARISPPCAPRIRACRTRRSTTSCGSGTAVSGRSGGGSGCS